MQKTSTHSHAPQTEGRLIRWARFYDPLVALLTLGRERAIRKMTVEMADLKPGEKVLDVGCGTGSLTIAAKVQIGPDGEVHGIDGSPEMIEVALRKADQAGASVAFQVGLIEDLSFPDHSFDVVMRSLMIHHLPGNDLRRRGLAEIHRVLKPGGRFFAVDYEPLANPFLRVMTGILSIHGTKSTFQGLPAIMDELGFTEIEMGRTKYSMLAFIRGSS